MSDHLYIYQTGYRPDGFQYAVASTAHAKESNQLALFVDLADAHLYAYDKAERMNVLVHIMPSAEPEPNRAGWPRVIIRENYRALIRGEFATICPECGSFDVYQTLRPGAIGTGPGRSWRMGDPGGVPYFGCNSCGHMADVPPAAQTTSWADSFGVWHVRVSRRLVSAEQLLAVRHELARQINARQNEDVAEDVWMNPERVKDLDDGDSVVYREGKVSAS